MAISVQYNLTGAGWSECIIEIGYQQAHLIASYLSDALADLLDAVTALVRGADEATASFTEEPGEYRWLFKRVPQDGLCVRIFWFDGNWSDGNGFADCPSVATRGHCHDGEVKLILEAEYRLRTFAGAVLSASQRVLVTR